MSDVDPIIIWPSVTAPPLRPMLDEMRRLNSLLGVPAAISTRVPDDADLPEHFRRGAEASGRKHIWCIV